VVVHELATNAAKYGALSVSNGRLGVTWTTTDDGRLILSWAETGGPTVAVPTREGFGTLVLRDMTQQANGETRFDWRPAGLVCEIELPI
jgi:two-component sensor histidine kinase